MVEESNTVGVSEDQAESKYGPEGQTASEESKLAHRGYWDDYMSHEMKNY